MQVSIETTEGLERRLTVVIPSATVDHEVEKRLKEAGKTARINGFRQGKVPMRVIKQRYGAGVRQEVLGETIQRSFYEAVTKESVRPAGQPSIEATQAQEGKDVEYVATFEVYPDLTLNGVHGIELTVLEADVTDADIDNMIDNLRNSNSEWLLVERPAAMDDQVDIDFAGKVNGEPFDGGSASGHKLVLGSDAMIPGFEAGVVGMEAGETKSLALVFPEDYHAEELRGVDTEFSVTLNTVEQKQIPELNDEFFSKFGVDEGGEEAFRKDVLANMKRELDSAIKNKVTEQLFDGLLSANDIALPAALVDAEIDVLRKHMAKQYGAAVENLDLKDILPDDMFRERAVRRVRLGLLVNEIVVNEKIESDKDVVRRLIEDASTTYDNPEEFIAYSYSDDEILRLVEAAALEEQVVEFLRSKANITAKSVTYEEAMKPAEPPPVADDEAGA